MAAGKNVKFQGSAIAVATGKLTGKVITAITKANPCVVSSTAHGFATGDLVWLAAIVGMTELNGDWYYVQNSTANTFELRGIDSTGYGAYVNGGTAQAPSWANWCECKSWNETGGASSEISVETICSITKEYEAGLADTSTVAMDFNWGPKFSVGAFLDTARATGETVPMRVSLPANQGVLTYKMGILQISNNGQISNIWQGSCSLRVKEARGLV
jgi:Ubiquitin-activating enzyme E1 FCCH domain/Phage tail tube protein, TTP